MSFQIQACMTLFILLNTKEVQTTLDPDYVLCIDNYTLRLVLFFYNIFYSTEDRKLYRIGVT